LTPNLRLRAALCLALSLADLSRARAEEPVPASRAADADENPCVSHAAVISAWRSASHDVKVAERSLEKLEADPVSSSEGSCSAAAIAAGRCRHDYYNKDQALEDARDRLEDAQQKVTQVEESARTAGVPDLCLVQ
jgi:hypothetical protein